MANADDIARTIEPGSLPQGQRQQVAGQLQQALGGLAEEAPAPPPPRAAPEAAVDPNIDPLSRLMSGDHSSDLPITSGLPHGPGSNGAKPISETPKASKLREIAMHARSPVLRHQARQALRRELRAHSKEGA